MVNFITHFGGQNFGGQNKSYDSDNKATNLSMYAFHVYSVLHMSPKTL